MGIIGINREANNIKEFKIPNKESKYNINQKMKPKIALLTHDSDKTKENNKIICIRCSDNFKQLFFKEQILDIHDDEILQDIAEKKVYMKWNEEQKIFECKCGNTLMTNQSRISSPAKKLRVAGIENNMFNKYNSDINPDFTKAVEKKYNNSYDNILFNDSDSITTNAEGTTTMYSRDKNKLTSLEID